MDGKNRVFQRARRPSSPQKHGRRWREKQHPNGASGSNQRAMRVPQSISVNFEIARQEKRIESKYSVLARIVSSEK